MTKIFRENHINRSSVFIQNRRPNLGANIPAFNNSQMQQNSVVGSTKTTDVPNIPISLVGFLIITDVPKSTFLLKKPMSISLVGFTKQNRRPSLFRSSVFL